jgi:CPA2 family monovalent cation:H+ antiporter-2
VLPAEGGSLIVAGALLSIALNPLLFAGLEPLQRGLLRRSAWLRRREARVDPLAELPARTEPRYLARQVVLVGCGEVGRAVAQALAAQQVPFVVVDADRERVEQLRAQGWAAIYGDASRPEVLVQAHIAEAGLLLVAIADGTELQPMLQTARALNPSIPVIARAQGAEDAARLRETGVDRVLHPKPALAEAMAAAVLDLRAAAGRRV